MTHLPSISALPTLSPESVARLRASVVVVPQDVLRVYGYGKPIKPARQNLKFERGLAA